VRDDQAGERPNHVRSRHGSCIRFRTHVSANQGVEAAAKASSQPAHVEV
jgi:hypothetical protein